MSLNTTPRTWVLNEVVTFTEMNTEIRDAFTGIQAAWSTYTTTSGGITVGNGTLTSRYQQIGKTIDVFIQFVLGTTSAVSSSPTFSLPVAARVASWSTGDGVIFHSGNTWPVGAIATNTTTLACRVWPTTAGNAFALLSGTVPVTWASTDSLTISARYESA